jgi:hypothetical protein
MPKAAPYTASNGFAVSIDQHTLLASPDARGLVASVLAVVERETARHGRGRDAVLLAVERWYEFHGFGWHLGNVG